MDNACLLEAATTEIVETASSDTPMLRMQQMREGFLEIHERDGLPSMS